MTVVVSSGIGSWPGDDLPGAVRTAFAECPELPYVPELPARGPYAGMIGRTTALLTGMGLDLVPAGWRLTDGSSADHRRAGSVLRSDLDVVEEVAQGYVGEVKLSLAGPWTLAASVERPRGGRALGDPGARRDLGQSLADGLADLLVELGRRLPDVAWVVQLDEPLLPAVLAGRVATASGWGTYRPLDPPEVSAALGRFVTLAAPAPVLVHCCAPDPPVGLLQGAGVRGLLLDVDQLGRREIDALGPGAEAGLRLGLGALPSGAPADPDRIARRALGLVEDLRVDPAGLSLLLTGACGFADADPTSATRALRALRTAAGIVADTLAG